MANPGYFRTIYVWSGVWQSMGYGAIVYLAALTAVDPDLQEAALIDGASRLKRIWYIDLPCILPQIVLMLILRCGQLMNVGFEKVYLMQNSLNLSVSEVISTYVYKVGLLNNNFSFSAAIGLFNNAVSLVMVLFANFAAKRLSGSGLF